MKTGKIISFSILISLLYIESFSQTGWAPQTSGTTADLRAVSFINGNTGFAAGTGIILKTTNSGSNWFSYNLINIDFYAIQFLDSSYGYAAGYYKPTELYKTTNGGTNWSLVTFPPFSAFPYSMHFFNQNTGFILTYKTTDGGNQWTDTYPASQMRSLFFIDDNTGWGCNSAGNVIKTTNAGTNWVLYNISSASGLQSVFFINSQTGWIASSTSKLYKTTNGGVNWTLFYDQGLCGLNSVFFINEQTGWVCGCEGSINGTTNNGATWTQQSFATTTYLYSLSFASPLTGWAVGAGGRILKTTTGGITAVQQISSEIPNSFSLSQNYPNPFNPSTKIKFNIPGVRQRHAFDVHLKIYDISGREIATFVNEQLQPGSYEINFDGSELASGIYYYELIAGEYSDTKKMILLK